MYMVQKWHLCLVDFHGIVKKSALLRANVKMSLEHATHMLLKLCGEDQLHLDGHLSRNYPCTVSFNRHRKHLEQYCTHSVCTVGSRQRHCIVASKCNLTAHFNWASYYLQQETSEHELFVVKWCLGTNALLWPIETRHIRSHPPVPSHITGRKITSSLRNN